MIAAVLLLLTLMPAGTMAEGGTTCTILIKYIDAETEKPVADPYKAVLASGDEYSHDSPSVDGYTLADSSQATISGTASEDKTIIVKYKPGEAQYKINYYFQNADDVYVKDDSKTETKTAACNSTVTIEPETFTGYECVTAGDDLKLSIPTDGTTVEADLYYKLSDKQSILYFRTGGGSHVEKIVAAPGTDVTAEIAERTTGIKKPTKTGYTFDSWESGDASFDPTADPCTMPDHNVTLTAKWNPGTANYRVIYWCEDTYNHGNYYVGATDERSGTVGTSAEYEALSEEDLKGALLEFEKADENVEIKADGSTVLNVYYRKIPVKVIIYYRDWNTSPNSQLIGKEVTTLRVGDDITEIPSDEYIKNFFDQDQLHGTDPNVIDGVWGSDMSVIKLRWTYYNPTVSGDDMQSHMRYFSSDLIPYVTPRGVDWETKTLKVYPDFRAERNYVFFDAAWKMNPNTNQYEKVDENMEYNTVDGTGDEKIRIRPAEYQGYDVKYVRYSTEAYTRDPGKEPVLGPFQEIEKDASGNIPDDVWFYRVADPSNYIAFYFHPKEYPLNYIVNGSVVHTENLPCDLNKKLDYVPEVPAELAAQGYTFAGWYEVGDDDQTLVDSTTIKYNENNFVAKFKAPEHTVTFDLNGGAMDAATTQTVEHNMLAAEPDPAPTRDDYVFAGWYYKDSGVLYEFDQPVDSDIELIARWRPAADTVKYTVRHQLADGTVLKTEEKEVSSRTRFAAAKCLDEKDAAYPDYPVVPDAIYKSLLLTASADDNVITFTYKPTPTYEYTVQYLDKDTGAAVSDAYTFSDIAQIMTVIAKDLDGYTAAQIYGRGDTGNTTIHLYYAKNDTSITAGDPPVVKKVTGDKPAQDAAFTFTMAALPDDSTLPAGMTAMPMPGGASEQSVTAVVKGSGSTEFGDLTFTEPGTYVYRVTENNTGDRHYRYDTSEYLLTYVVTRDANGKLACTRTLTKDGAPVTEAAVTFINRYQGDSTTPAHHPSDGTPAAGTAASGLDGGAVSTGDPGTSSRALFFIMLAAGLACCGAAAAAGRQRRHQ
ncbi:MAG: InlB B-repeat-containing protein [Anaerovoracaceae bacterium]